MYKLLPSHNIPSSNLQIDAALIDETRVVEKSRINLRESKRLDVDLSKLTAGIKFVLDIYFPLVH